MKNLIYILLALTFASCNSPLKKSVFDPLSLEELKTTIKKDSLFEQTYKNIQFVRDSVLKSEIDKVKWSDLTYKRIQEFVHFSHDTTNFNYEQISNQWQDKYGIYLTKVDSISDYWKKYKEENSLDQYVKIDLVEIDKEYYSYAGGIKNVNLGIKLTPLKGKIDQMRFGYSIEAKLDEDKEKSIYSSIYSGLDKSWCRMSSPFSQPVVRYWEANYTNEKILEDRTVQTFLRDYNIYFEVDEIRKDGVNISNDDLGIPECVENHWRYENEEYLKDLYVDDIIKDILHVEYVPKYEFLSDELQKILKKKDQLSYDFLALSEKFY